MTERDKHYWCHQQKRYVADPIQWHRAMPKKKPVITQEGRLFYCKLPDVDYPRGVGTDAVAAYENWKFWWRSSREG